MKKEALLLIDIQNIYFTPGPLLLHKPKEAAKNAAKLLEKFRAEKKAVIHVQHDFKALSGIHNLVKPIEGEKIIHKEKPSSFLGTDLLEYLHHEHVGLHPQLPGRGRGPVPRLPGGCLQEQSSEGRVLPAQRGQPAAGRRQGKSPCSVQRG